RVIDIALSCGYDNASKFTAAFRAVIGCSPREYRNRVRSE
ncbi:MAG: AraC family transcriptional regulator, partial [Oscillospiraceae bacterium]|nr:AraC family transcriptional regulator [Oscillospiraceae bacterium]